MISNLLNNQKELLVVEFNKGESYPRLRHMRRLEVLAEVREQGGLSHGADYRRHDRGSIGGDSEVDEAGAEARGWRRQRRRAAYALPLQPRDLRMVDPTFSNADDPSLLVREGCIIVNLLPVRAMLTCDRVLLFPKEGVDGEVSLILDKLRPDSGADNVDMPFELRALEACFVTMLSDLQRHTHALGRTVRRIAKSLARNDTSLSVLQGLRGAFNDIAEVQQRCAAKRDTLVGVLDHPATLRGLSSLTLREQGRGSRRNAQDKQSRTLSAGANDRGSVELDALPAAAAAADTAGAAPGALPSTAKAPPPPSGSIEPGTPRSEQPHDTHTQLAGAPEHHHKLVHPDGSVHLVIPPPLHPVQGSEPHPAVLAAQASASPATRALARPITGETLMALQLQAGMPGAAAADTGRRLRRGSSAASAPAVPGDVDRELEAELASEQYIETAATLEHADTARLTALQPASSAGGLAKGISELSETEQLDYHADVAELLVEAYVAEVEAVIRDLASLQSELESAERQQNLMLATTRNRLLLADIGISSTTLVLAVLAALYSMFGMNLNSGLEDTDGVFWGVVYGSLGAGAAMWVALVLALKFCLLAPGDSSASLQCRCAAPLKGHSKR